MSKYDVLLIGGGPNGLVAAARLAAAGRKVLVLEQRKSLGGLAGSFEFAPGYQSSGVLNDTGALAPEVIQALQLEKHGLVLQGPASVLLLDGKNGLVLGPDPAVTSSEISNFSQKDASQYLAWCAFLKRIRPFVANLVRELPEGVEGLQTRDLMGLLKKGLALRKLGRKDMLEILRISMMCTGDWLNEWFETDLLKAGLAAPAHYGSFTGPWSPGTTLNLLLAYCSRAQAVKGGSAALIQVLEKAVRAAGGEIRLNSQISRIKVAKGQVQGVVLADGSSIEAQMVVASCHPKHALLDLVEPSHLAPITERDLSLYRSRGTTALVSLALNAKPNFSCRPSASATYLRLVSTLDNLERSFDPVKYRELPANPVLEVHRGSLENPSAAPSGHESLSVMVHFVPYALEGGWNEEAKARLAKTVIDQLAVYAPGLAKSVVASAVQTPADMEREYGTSGGHIYQGELAFDQLLIRPTLDCTANATPIEGLFLCGNGTRCGGGLTGLPGLMGADRALQSRR